jgi:predicted nucleotidyltransferase
MRTTEQIKDFLDAVTDWAAAQPDIKAVALIGSYARGAATDKSDIDLLILVAEPHQYLADTSWTTQFGLVAKQQLEDYGRVTSLRVWYVDGYEVEYGLTTPAWIQPPWDKGTQLVLESGLKILFERVALFSPGVQNS